MMMLLFAGLLSMAAAEEQFPGWGAAAWNPMYNPYAARSATPTQSATPSASTLPQRELKPYSPVIWSREASFGNPVPAAEEPAAPQCEDDAKFFSTGIGSALIEHPEYDPSNLKISLARNKKFFQVDQPFSHKANELSLMEVEGLDDEPGDEETKAANMRELIRNKNKWSSDRLDKAERERRKELEKEMHDLKTKKEAATSIDFYYVNMDNAKERKNCVERQFKDMPGKPQPIRFPAIQFPDRCAKKKKNRDYEACLKESGLGDCFVSGIDYAATGTHGSQEHDTHRIRNAIISNWCGHKRLFESMEQQRQNGTAPEYFVVLEDDVVLDRKYFTKVIKDFVTNYENRDWDAVQLDPFGHKDRKDMIGQFRGKPVFKPAADGQCSAYWGFHAVLVKTAALHRINHWMSINQAVPIDWLPWRMPHMLAYSALVSRNPEAQMTGGAVVLPSYCSAKVMKSTIA